MDKIFAPFDERQIAALNDFQRSNRFHPFTCGGDRHDKAHMDYMKKHQETDNGILIADKDGWRCPVCDYRQSWAWSFMARR